MEFKRGIEVKDALGLGGYSFETLRKGAVLEVKSHFGVTREAGKLRHINSCAVECPRGHFLLITRIEDIFTPKYSKASPEKPADMKLTHREIHFIVHQGNMWDRVMEDKKRMRLGEAFPGWRRTGHMGHISKAQFDNRLTIIEPGI